MKFRDYNEPICPFTISGEGEMECLGHTKEGECINCPVKKRYDTEMEKDAQKVTEWWYEQLLLDCIHRESIAFFDITTRDIPDIQG